MAKLKNISKGRFLATLKCALTGWRLRHREIESIEDDDFFHKFLADQGHIIGALATEAWDEHLYEQGKPPGLDVDVVLADRGVTRADEDLWLQTAIEITEEALQDPDIWAIYEATVNIDNFTTRADILNKQINKKTGGYFWEMIEVKSIVSLSLKEFPKEYMEAARRAKHKDPRQRYIKDMAYTVMVLRRADIDVRKAGLMNVNKSYTDENKENFMTVSWEFAPEVKAIVKGWQEETWYDTAGKKRKGKWEEIETLTRSPTRPWPQFAPSCKRCPSCTAAIDSKSHNYILDIPNMGSAGMLEQFQDLVNADIFCIEDIPDKFWDSGRSYQRRAGIITESTKRKKPYLNTKEGFEIDGGARHGLLYLLSNKTIEWYTAPDNTNWVWYLDFEILATAVPLWSNVRPYERVPIQYSVHGAAAERKYLPNLYGPTLPMHHREFIARPEMDERIKMATQLTEDIGPRGSIFVYHASVERGMIEYLMRLPGLSPDIIEKLDSIRRRLVDLLSILRGGSVKGEYVKSDCNFYDPRFKGSYSLKNVIKIFPHNPYEALEISKGDEAAAQYGRLAYAFSYDNSPWTPENFTEEMVERTLTGLRQYCAIDTLMLNWLHKILVQHIYTISNEKGQRKFLAIENILFAYPGLETCLDCGASYPARDRSLHGCKHIRERDKACDLRGRVAS